MKLYSPKLYLKDLWVLVPSVASLASVLVACGYLFFMVPTGETTYFLHTTIVFGVDLVGGYWSLFRPVLVGALMFVVSESLAFVLYGTERFLARALLFFLVIAEFGIVAATYLIVGLNV